MRTVSNVITGIKGAVIEAQENLNLTNDESVMIVCTASIIAALDRNTKAVNDQAAMLQKMLDQIDDSIIRTS